MPGCMMDVNSDSQNIAVIGANGMLAGMIRERAPKNCTLHLFDLPGFNMTDCSQVSDVLGALSPDLIINCAAFTNVDGAETEQELAMAVNGVAVGHLAKVALEVDAILVHISTDYVFDGQQSTPYVETDAPNPQSVYGRTKLAGEEAIVESGLDKYYIIRTSWLYGPDGNNFVETVLRLATEREEMWIVADQVGTPTHTGDLADAVFALLNSCADYGVYHFADEGQCSWYDFACAIVTEGRGFGLPLKVREIHPITTEDYPLPAKRPVNSVFDKGKYKAATGLNIPGWRASLHRYFPQREIKS